jgi:tripeptidyl-peptidase-1
MVGPSQKTIETITKWLNEEGATNIRLSKGKTFLSATVSLPLAARLFDIQFHTYRHQSGVSVDASAGPYTLPSNIAELVDFVSGPVGFPDVTVPMIQVNSAPSLPSLDINPSVIRARYNVSTSTVGTNPGNMHAVAEFQAQYYSPADLQQFWTSYVPFAPFQAVANVVGFNNPSNPGIEASLDIQYIMSVAPNVTTWFYSMKSFNFWQDLTTWTQEIDNETNPPYIHSVSYGEQGDYPSDAYRSRLNQEFQKLGTRGLTIVFASGDDGAGCQGAGTSDEPNLCDCTFYPSFPATCPYVLTVGATKFLTGTTGAEGAVVAFKSGGGFSQYFPPGSYQTTAIAAYLQSGVTMPEACAFNASGRATPDVSALGDIHFQVINGGTKVTVGGTSASSPTFSAILTLLNDIRLNNGESTLGFVAPWIYQTAASNPTAFFDVTVGDNFVSGCCSSGKQGGFECATGWDPVTGVGTPNFAVLSTLV